MSGAFASSTALAAGSISALSRAKNTGRSGELRLSSSSVADAIASSRTGSGGTVVGSTDGRGGAGGRAGVGAGGVALATGGGGGSGRATGGFLPPHPRATTVAAISTNSAGFAIDIVCSILSGPVGLVVVAGPRHLFQVPAVPCNREDLCLAG